MKGSDAGEPRCVGEEASEATERAAAATDIWRVEKAEAGERVDRHVARRLEIPRNQVQRWLAEGRIEVNARPVRPARKLEAGAEVRCRRPPAPASDRVTPEEGPLAILHEDEHLVVLDKPAGLAMHPGAGRRSGTLAHRLLARYPEILGVGGPGRPGIVHRLDMGTSGAVVIARSQRAYLGLSRAFSERQVSKSYLTLAHGKPKEELIRIEAPIARHRQDRKLMAVRRGGRPAVSELHRIETTARLVFFEVRIETGRTHQIRVHLKHAGFPIIGDPLYGEARWRSCAQRLQGALRDFSRPALHAWRLAFQHPITSTALTFEVPPAPDLEELWTLISGHSVSEALRARREGARRD